MTITVVRHPETEWNRDHIVQGQLDSPLTGTGTATAQELGRKIQHKQYRGFFTSDLGRCTKTAEILSAYLPIKPIATPLLRERDFGSLNDKKQSLVESKIDKHNWDEVAPGGESIQQVRARIEEFLNSLTPNSSPVLCVTHEGVLRILLALSQGTKLQNPRCDSSQKAAYMFSYKNGELNYYQTF